MRNLFVTRAAAADIVRSGAVALFAGSEAALATLPTGTWIGGTTAYFMTEHGGAIDTERLFCTIIDTAVVARGAHFAPDALASLATGQYRNGFTYVLVPGQSAAHRRYALESLCFPDLFTQPVMGWVTGTPADDPNARAPKVFFGPTGEAFEDKMLALYIRLPDGIVAEVDTVNLFTQGFGPEIVFPRTDFFADECLVDGVPAMIGHYFAGCDTRLPLVADFAGVMVNVALLKSDPVGGSAQFYAPVVAGETYRLAQPVADYHDAYASHAAAFDEPARTLSCNCVLNFLYAGLEGKSTGGYVGPVAFGEIAYILVTQTLVRLSLVAATAPVASPSAIVMPA